MAERVSRLAPPAALAAPDQATREQGLKALRLELEAQKDDGLAALLQHEVARLHERREDLASAARDELATTKKAATFVEPIESLIDIATRSRSRANLAKLLERLTKLARAEDEQLRAALSLSLTQLASEEVDAARGTLEAALQRAPTESALWIALETVAAESADSELLLKAATGRAAHAQSDEMRCLLLERVARLHAELGDGESAFAALRQSVEEIPTWRALHTWEELGARTENFPEAVQAATQTATILRAGLEEPDEASLYQIPDEELSEERAIAAHIRAVVYSTRGGDDAGARTLAEQLSEASPDSALALALLTEVYRKQGDAPSTLSALSRLIEARKWNNEEAAALHCLATFAAEAAGDAETRNIHLAKVEELAPSSQLPKLRDWLAAEADGSLQGLEAVLGKWADADEGESSFVHSVCLVRLLLGDYEGAENTSTKFESSDTVGALLKYALATLKGDTSGRVSLPPQIGSEKDQRALVWEAARQGLAGLSEGIPEERLDDAWARLALSLLRIEPTAAPRVSSERSSSEAHDDPLIDRNAPPLDDGTEEEPVDEAEGEVASTAALENPDQEHDGVIAGLTAVSPDPGDVEHAEEESDEARLENSDSDATQEEPATQEEAATQEEPEKDARQTEADDSGPPKEKKPRSGIRAIAEEYLYGVEAPTALAQALRVHLLAESGDRIDLRKQWEAAPGDPLLAGALTALLETQGSAHVFQVRRKAAEMLEDETLRSAWLLKSAADALDLGKAQDALSAVEASGSLANDGNLAPWFRALKGGREPRSTLRAWQESAPNRDDELEFAALLQRYAPEEWNDFEPSEPNPALQMLQVLHTATSSLEELEYALDDTQFFTEKERSALPLARKFMPNEGIELLQATRAWARVAPSPASQLTLWVAGIRAADPLVQKEAIQALAATLESPTLATAVPASDLSKAERDAYRTHLEALREEQGENNPSISWAIAEAVPQEISEEHAVHMSSLGGALDADLKDPDAQAAALLAGYEYLALQRFEEALELFEPLLELLPGDLTLCQGARIAAANVGRPDLEASTTCELAKSTEDNLKSAALWERAGVLYQDVLDNDEEAERCYTAALARSPGSRVAFERIYRFARDRNDRQRQVELIDSRLDTAESESLIVELYWEKARFCRMLGRRTIALRSIEELLKLAPDHLPSLALAAELHLVDGRIDAAAEALRSVAKHPDTPPAQRGAAGLHACDLFEQLRKPREAVELLQVLDEYGVSGSAGLERRARSLARSGDWGEAYLAFADLNSDQDEIDTRLESARMMLAIQRDHLKDPEELKRSARCVLRDAPVDPDAISVVLEQSFPPEERRRLLAPARRESLESLRKNPLNPPEIQRFAGLCLECGEDYLERIALGNLGLTGKLPQEFQERLEELLGACLPTPSAPLSRSDLEALADPLQLGSAGRYIQLISPFLAKELDPSLEALGFSSLMRTDEFSGSAHRAEIGTWVGCFGDSDFELYVGGSDPHLIRGMHGDLPTLLVGKDVPVPLTPVDRARVVAQLSALHYDTVTFLNHPPELLQKWIIASEILAGSKSSPETAGEIDEMARKLSRTVPREVREELTHLRGELTRAGVELGHAPYVVMRGAGRAACLSQGEANIIRQLPEILPADKDMMRGTMADLVRFVLSGEFINMRRKIGLEGA